MTFDVEKTRKDFPILSREIQGNNLTYLDNAASSQKPIDVLEGIKPVSYTHLTLPTICSV